MSAETLQILQKHELSIKDVAKLYGRSERGIRTLIANKQIPAPRKRKSLNEPYRWKTSDIRRDLNLENSIPANDPEYGSIDAIIDQRARQIIREEFPKLIKEFLQELRQTPNF